jgi:hypothetical protein
MKSYNKQNAKRGANCFFRHSPLPGANDEKSSAYVDRYPGLRLLPPSLKLRRTGRSLTLGYHLPPLRGFKMAGEVFFRTIFNRLHRTNVGIAGGVLGL